MSGDWRRLIATLLPVLAMSLGWSCKAHCTTTQSAGVLKADIESKVIDLIADPGFERPGVGGWIFRSIGISPTHITFRLMAPADAEDSQGRATIELLPKIYAAPGGPISQSFAIRTTNKSPDPHAAQMMSRAIKSIQTRDKGGFYTAVQSSEPPPPKAGRPGLLRRPWSQSMWFGLIPWLLVLIWWRRPRGSSPSQAETTLPWSEWIGYGLLSAVYFGPTAASVVGVQWGVPLTVFLYVALTVLGMQRRWLQLSSVGASSCWAVGVVAVALCAAWMRTGVHDDPFCHHAYVQLLVKQGAPIANPGDPTQLAGYHTGFDLLAATIQSWLPLGGDVEWALDVTTALSLFALMAAGITLLAATGAPTWLQASAVPLLVFASGPLWLGRWIAPLRPEWAPWQTLWEGGTLMSPLALFGRRPAIIAFLITYLFFRSALCGELQPKRLHKRAGWLSALKIALCLAGASQCADELLALLVCACLCVGLSYGRVGLMAWRKPLVLSLLLAPLALLNGGFAAQVVLQALGLTQLSGSESSAHLMGLGAPAWPSFFGAMVAIGDSNWWRVALMEFGGAWWTPIALLWLSARDAKWRDAAIALACVSGVCTIAACTFRFEALDYQVDLHRFVEAGSVVALVLLPICVHQLLRRRSIIVRLSVTLSLIWLHCCAAIGQLLDNTGTLALLAGASLIAWAASIASSKIQDVSHRLWARTMIWAPGMAACALLAGWLFHPATHIGPPPGLPTELAHWIDHNAPASPVLSTAMGSNTMLLQGRYVAASHHRADLNPITERAHQQWLHELTVEQLRALGVQAFLLPDEDIEQLKKRWGPQVQWDRWGRWPAQSVKHVHSRTIATGVPPQTINALIWGRIRVSP